MIYNIHKYIFYKVHISDVQTKCSRGSMVPSLLCAWETLGSIPIGYVFLFIFYYFTWNTKRLSRRAGLSAIAEFLVRTYVRPSRSHAQHRLTSKCRSCRRADRANSLLVRRTQAYRTLSFTRGVRKRGTGSCPNGCTIVHNKLTIL